ncbi:MAG: MFS transporter [Clostridiales bacterium]|nr:MFS transporter [Clostridiales bacterium]
MKDKTQRLWSRDFVIVMLASSGISFCNYFFVSTLPIYAQNITGTTFSAGLMTAVFTFAALATRPFTGILTDKVGRVKLLVAGAVLCAAASILYRFSTVIVILILVRTLHGIGFGIHTTCGGAAAADIIPKSRLSEGLGIFGLYGTIASALAPAIALGIIGTGENERFLPLFTLSAVIAVICAILDMMIRYERGKPKSSNNGIPTVEEAVCSSVPLPRLYMGFEKGVFIPAVVLILVFIAISTLAAFLTIFSRDMRLGDIGLFFTISAAGMLSSRLLFGKVADRRGADIVVIPALAAIIPCLALIPFAPSRFYLFVLAFPLGLAQGIVCPAVNSMMFQRCSPKRRGSASAAYFAAIDLGYGIGAFLFGIVAEKLGFNFVWWGSALFALMAFVIYLVFLRGKDTKVT